MDGQKTRAWQEQVNARQSRIKPPVDDQFIDCAERVTYKRPLRRNSRPELLGVKQFTLSELSHLQVLAMVYAPETQFPQLLRQEIIRQNV